MKNFLNSTDPYIRILGCQIADKEIRELEYSMSLLEGNNHPIARNRYNKYLSRKLELMNIVNELLCTPQ